MDMIKIKGTDVWIGRGDGMRCSIAGSLVAISAKGAPVVCRDIKNPLSFVEGYFAALGVEIQWITT